VRWARANGVRSALPVYSYKGVNNAGRATRGFVDADSDRTARQKLRREGLYLTELVESTGSAPTPTEESSSRFSFTFVRSIPGSDLAIATRQLATLLGAGIPLVESLGALSEQVEHPRLKSVIAQVRDRVNEGATLGDALARAGVFSDLFVSMVRAGEAGGALEQVLRRLADYLESQVRTRNRVISIMLYPLMMASFAVLVVIALVTLVLPQITQLLEGMNMPLPWYTQAIISGSRFLRAWWWALAVVGGLAGLGIRGVVRTERGREGFDRLQLRLPVFGRVIRILAISRFTRTLSTLLAGGIPIVRSLEISKFVADNRVIGEAIDRARESITEGSSIAAPLKRSGQFPPLVTHMVDVGEKSGALEAMLAKVADTYDEQVETAVTRLTALLEPMLILIMVGIVLVIILSTLVPLLQLTSAIR
jgi:general secretion pathway protein F